MLPVVKNGLPEQERPAGLSSAEAAAALERHGPNALAEATGRPLWRRFLGQFHDPLIYLLLGALLLAVGDWLWHEGGGWPLEAVVIATILLLNATLGVVQEGRAERALERLQDLAAPQAWVVRDGALARVAARDVVPGDAVRLEAGDRVVADGVLERAEGVRLDESIVTGESMPLDKGEGERALSGTLLVRGLGWLRVEETGPDSTMGRLATLLRSVEPGATPLERRLRGFGRTVVRWVLGAAAAVVVAGVAVGGLESLQRVVLFAVALAVAVVPEGLPAILTLTLSLGVERMARRQAVVRRLPAVEALGSVTAIATDKTGTLTENRMVVRRVESDDEPRVREAMVLASDAPEDAVDVGDPLEQALLQEARGSGVDTKALRRSRPRGSTRPFDSKRKYMRVTVDEDGRRVSYLKGAPEVLLERSTLEPDERDAWLARAQRGAADGHKVLAIAWVEGEGEEGLTWGGLVHLLDPPRPEVPSAVAAARAAGIRVMMLTGDHPETAAKIAAEVGIPPGEVVTGAALDEATPEERAALVAEATVFARVSPAHKLELVEALQAQGEVVAMTGDGVNDAPALKRADVGVVMGQRGSDVAREAGDLILLDDDFATIVAAIEEGRSIYANIQKFIRCLFTTNLSEVVVILTGAVGSVALALEEPSGSLLLPLTAAMILWINLVTESIPAASLSLDTNPDVMRRPPRPPDAPLLDGPSRRYVLGGAAALAAAPLALLLLLPTWDYPYEATRTLVFHVLVCSLVLSTYHARRVAGRTAPRRVVHGAIALGLALQLTLAFVPPLHPFLGLTTLDPLLAGVGVVAVAASFGAIGGVTRFVREGADPE